MTNSAPIPETAERFAKTSGQRFSSLVSKHSGRGLPQLAAHLGDPEDCEGHRATASIARTNHELTFFMSGDAERTIADLMQLEFLSGLLVIKDGVIHIERYAMGLNPDR